MKPVSLAVCFIFSLVAINFAQTTPDQTCQQQFSLAKEAFDQSEFQRSAALLMKAENTCTDFSEAQYALLVKSLRNRINAEKIKEKKTVLIDTLVLVYENSEKRGMYNSKEDLTQAIFILQSSKPNRVKADELFGRGIQNNIHAVSETQLILYYYNLNILYKEATGSKKEIIKSRLVKEYLFLNRLILENHLSEEPTHTIQTYFSSVFPDCASLIPTIESLTDTLPTDRSEKEIYLHDILTVLANTECTLNPIFNRLVDSLDRISDNAESYFWKAHVYYGSKNYALAIEQLDSALNLVENPALEEQILFMKAIAFMETNRELEAYAIFMKIQGKLKNKALLRASNCVALSAQQCGSTTFEQQCNYLYAAELAEKGGDKTLADNLKAKGPSEELLRKNKSPKSIVLSCWNITYTFKQNN